MLVVEIVIVALILFAVGAVAAGRGGELGYFTPDRPPHDLPTGRPLTPTDIENARFSLAFRGYRMAEVDHAMTRLAAEIEWRDAELAKRAATANGGNDGHERDGRIAEPAPAGEREWPSSS